MVWRFINWRSSGREGGEEEQIRTTLFTNNFVTDECDVLKKNVRN